MKTILVADDDKHVRLLLETELTLEGYRVILARNGLEVLKRMKEESPDLLILDIKMPGMHGLQVLEAIRKENKKLPIIICTAYEKMRDDYTVWASRVAGFLVKPFDLSHLKVIIKRSLANKAG
ncbi:response regulator [Candidatus Aerophobetes bacterium]|nr:response regulator [Candidatus Aerophobetes bacterium]